MTYNVWAIIVTFNPNLETLDGLLQAIAGQVAQIYIVDNGSIPDILDKLRLRLEYSHLMLRQLGENTGVATALNVGIKAAIQNGASHCILFDQDSLPNQNMVAELLRVEEELLLEGKKVGAIGPTFIDKRNGHIAPFIEIKAGRVIRKFPETTKREVYLASYLISSGSLIRKMAIIEIGELQNEMFIDYVDIEWGLRASRKGFNCFGCSMAIMQHAIGDKTVCIPFSGKHIPLHSASRDYYLMRNAIFLYRHKNIPIEWKIADGLRLPLRFLFYALSSESKFQHIKMMSLGIMHGLKGKMGRFSKKARGFKK